MPRGVGFFLTFVAGGITGVMVAAAPFDWQVHDTYFVVAHFHYVLIGGVVFPILGGLHHWFPKMTGRMPSEGAGRLSFLLVFVGFHIAFFPQHILGLQGMPRRIYTYESDFGWNAYNLISTLGAYLLALGVVVFTLNLAHGWWRGPRAPADPWEGDSLEWSAASPPAAFNFASMPVVTSVAPRWEPAGAPGRDVARAVAALEAPAPGAREVLHTSPQTGVLEGAASLPGSSPWPLYAALSIGVALVGALVNHVPTAVLGTIATVVSVIRWTRPDGEQEDLGERPPGVSHRRTPGWDGFALGVLALGGVVGSLVYAYYYLSVTASQWPPAGVEEPTLGWSAVGVGLLALGAAAAGVGSRAAGRDRPAQARGALVVAAAAGGAAMAAVSDEVAALPFAIDDHGYGAAFVTLLGQLVVFAGIGAVLAAVVAFRIASTSASWSAAAGRIVALWWWFTAGSAIVVWVVLFASPRVL